MGLIVSVLGANAGWQLYVHAVFYGRLRVRKYEIHLSSGPAGEDGQHKDHPYGHPSDNRCVRIKVIHGVFLFPSVDIESGLVFVYLAHLDVAIASHFPQIGQDFCVLWHFLPGNEVTMFPLYAVVDFLQAGVGKLGRVGRLHCLIKVHRVFVSRGDKYELMFYLILLHVVVFVHRFVVQLVGYDALQALELALEHSLGRLLASAGPAKTWGWLIRRR